MQPAEPRISTLFVACAVVTLTSLTTAETTIKPQEQWSAVFADTEPVFHFQVATSQPLQAVVRWSYSANGRTILRAERSADVTGEDPLRLDVKLRVPPVNPGVIFATDLVVGVYQRDEQEPLSTFDKQIWVFPRDPFVQRTRWLKELSIALFDPRLATANVFDAAEIPYRQVRDSREIGRLKAGVLVLGEGIDLDDHRGLADAMVAAASRGVPVLCLAPAAGRLRLQAEGALPDRLDFRRNEIITELDRRLDSQQWPAQEQIVASRFDYASSRGSVLLQTTESATGWPWIEARYGNNVPMIVCGFSLIEHWNDGPTPRFLFARLLERLTKSK